MSTRQVIIRYSGSTGLDIDEPGIVDDLPTDPTDDQIAAAIELDITYAIDNHGHGALDRDGGDVVPTYHYDRAALIASVRAEIERRRVDGEDDDDPPEYLGPTPPPRAHACDEDCHPFLRGEEDEHQECSVCGVSHGDQCPECGGRGYHDPDCSEVMERAEPIDRDEERAAHGDYLYDQMKDERLERERQP